MIRTIFQALKKLLSPLGPLPRPCLACGYDAVPPISAMTALGIPSMRGVWCCLTCIEYALRAKQHDQEHLVCAKCYRELIPLPSLDAWAEDEERHLKPYTAIFRNKHDVLVLYCEPCASAHGEPGRGGIYEEERK